MCASETVGGGDGERAQRVARARAGSCGASRRSSRGASGAGPSRKKRSRSPPSRSAQPRRGLLHAPVLGEPPRELLGRLLGLELGELGLLVREERARLQLEQRRDEHEELAAGLEVELVARGQPLDERDDDRGDVDLARLELLLQEQRQEQVERALERVEVQLELADGVGARAEASRAGGRARCGTAIVGPAAWSRPSRGGAAPRRCQRRLPPDEERGREQEADQRHPHVQAERRRSRARGRSAAVSIQKRPTQ